MVCPVSINAENVCLGCLTSDIDESRAGATNRLSDIEDRNLDTYNTEPRYRVCQ